MAQNHAHSRLANLRCQATRSINSLILTTTHPGSTIPIYERYDVSTSTRERQFNIAGDRGFYDYADLNQEVGVFNVNNICKPFIYTFIDTDYYVDLSEYSPSPMIIYTTIPQNLSGDDDEMSYYFKNKNIYCEKIHGGALFEHPLWDYSSDQVIMESVNNNNRKNFTVYSCDKMRQPDSLTKSIVLLSPKVTINCGLSEFKEMKDSDFNFNRASPLEHVELAKVDGFLIARKDKNVQLLNRTNNSSNTHMSIPTIAWEALTYVHHNITEMSQTVKASDIERTLKQFKIDDPRTVMACGRIFSANFEAPGVNYQLYPVHQATVHAELGTPTTKLLTTPITSQTEIGPCLSHNNELATVLGRIENVRNNTKIPIKRHNIINEFIQFMVPSNLSGTGVPVDIEDVCKKQNKPQQRARRANKSNLPIYQKNIVSAFQKRETYSKEADPRNISQCDVRHTTELSRYIYAFKVYLNNFSFKYSGKKPKDIADGISDYVRRHGITNIIETDYSRFDGTLSDGLRKIDCDVYYKYFGKSDELSLLSHDMNCNAFTRDLYQIFAVAMAMSQPITRHFVPFLHTVLLCLV